MAIKPTALSAFSWHLAWATIFAASS